MAYEVTSTRKRPRSFAELVGQEFVAATLASSLRQGRIAHAYLFAGPRGVGKTSVARILARSLNCDKGPTETPCGECPSCREITRGASLDVIEIDGASNTSVNDVREIRDEVLFAPNAARYKVYIIDEVHMLSNSAFNALLKTIEEPPPYIVFIFATTELHKVPATIRSRCQQYNFRLISTGDIRDKLREAARELGVEAEDRALIWIAKEATGSLRDAYTLLDQVASFGGTITLEKIREKLGVLGLDELNAFARILRAGDPGAVLTRLDELLAAGISMEQFVANLAEYFRGLLFLKSGIVRDSLLGADPADFDSGVLGSFEAPQIEKAIEVLLALYRNMRFSLNQRFELELVLARLSQLDSLITPREVRDALRELRGDEGREAPPRPVNAAAPTRDVSRERPPADPRASLRALGEELRREKPALASALDKVVSAVVESDELVLTLALKDRFQGEMAIKEKDFLLARLRTALPTISRVRVGYQETKSAPARVDQRVDLLRKVFRGEVVGGGEHGDQPV
jgi:DNA polymerase III subunit gamma/tau